MSKIRVSEGDDFELEHQSRAFGSRPRTLAKVDGDTGVFTVAVDRLLVAGISTTPDVVCDGIEVGELALAQFDASALASSAHAWVWSVRRSFYLDKDNELSPIAGVVVQAIGGGNWVSDNRPDRVWQEKTEWWLDTVDGDIEGDGAAEATAINSVTELGRRLGNGGGVTATTTLYTRFNLTIDEQAALDRVIAATGRQWRVVSGEMTVTPKLWFSAQDVNGDGNQPSDAALIPTLVNKGSLASGNATAAGSARPAFALLAEAGKLRNKSAVRYSSALQALVTGNVTAFTHPTWMLCIFKINAAGTKVPIDGNDGSHRNAIIDSNGSPVLYAGSSSGGIPGLPAMAKGDYHALVAVFSADRSTAQLDGVECTVAVDSGTQVLDGLDIGGLLSTAPITDGDIVEVIVVDGVGTMPSLLNDWIEYHYGVFPQ